jgi:hypothetical protein
MSMSNFIMELRVCINVIFLCGVLSIQNRAISDLFVYREKIISAPSELNEISEVPFLSKL